MLNWLRRMFAVRSPSRFGMTKEEWVECGKRMQEGFEEGYASVKEKCAAFQMDVEKAVGETINSEKQSPPGCEGISILPK